jgi:hypothetical protein
MSFRHPCRRLTRLKHFFGSHGNCPITDLWITDLTTIDEEHPDCVCWFLTAKVCEWTGIIVKKTARCKPENKTNEKTARARATSFWGGYTAQKLTHNQLIKRRSNMTTEEVPAAAVVDTDSVENEIKESKYGRWSHAVQDYVSVDLFRYVQFINREEEIMFGSGIQKVVCKACRIPERDQLEFWTNVGRDKVQEVFKRKRQTVATSFRSQFESKRQRSVYCGVHAVY